MFCSSFEGGLDSKGRVSIPASFRNALGGATHIYLWPALDGGGCLEGGGQALIDSYRQILMRMSPQDINRRAYIYGIFSKCAELSLDTSGRVSIPPKLISSAQLTERIMFVGALDRFQIWNMEAYQDYDLKMQAALSDAPDALDAPFSEVIASNVLSKTTA